MGRVRRLRRASMVIAVGLAVGGMVGPFDADADAGAAPPPPGCTDPATGVDPACLPGGTVTQLQRQACSYAWIEALCAATAWDDPGYAVAADPHPGDPYRLYVGAVHEHSGYSDGDPTAIPLDYFTAARTGHNVDGGVDTGTILDFLWSSEHSDNVQLPVTTAAVCLDPLGWLACAHPTESSHYWKWPAALEQAVASTTDTFTAVRGFEWTNDYFNHMNVYFSTNFTNVKVDGGYATMDALWDWLREPVATGGGADALVTFNHPGGDPALSPFDGDLPHNQLLAEVPGGGNWNGLAYVPDVDDRVAGIEVNGGDDIGWYALALANGWHVGPLANEDEHGRAWASSAEGKTLLLARGRSPQDQYWAFQHHRTIALHDQLVGGAPGSPATHPSIRYWADGPSLDDAAAVLGDVLIDAGGGSHVLSLDIAGLPPGSRVSLVSDAAGGLAAPVAVGAAGDDGRLRVDHPVSAPADGEDWWFAVVCAPATGPDDAPCGSTQGEWAVTAPIWLRSS